MDKSDSHHATRPSQSSHRKLATQLPAPVAIGYQEETVLAGGFGFPDSQDKVGESQLEELL